MNPDLQILFVCRFSSTNRTVNCLLDSAGSTLLQVLTFLLSIAANNFPQQSQAMFDVYTARTMMRKLLFRDRIKPNFCLWKRLVDIQMSAHCPIGSASSFFTLLVQFVVLNVRPSLLFLWSLLPCMDKMSIERFLVDIWFPPFVFRPFFDKLVSKRILHTAEGESRKRFKRRQVVYSKTSTFWPSFPKWLCSIQNRVHKLDNISMLHFSNGLKLIVLRRFESISRWQASQSWETQENGRIFFKLFYKISMIYKIFKIASFESRVFFPAIFEICSFAIPLANFAAWT